MSLISVITAPVVPLAYFPKAEFAANPAFGVVGSVVKLDGRLSSDPDEKALTYAWRFVSVPIGSQVQGEGFRTLDVDSVTNSPSLVSFSPDLVGEYVIGLVVSNGTFSSTEVTNAVSIRAILIPHGRGIIPDGKFIWSYIRDVWSQVDGKEFFETLWSALIQITGSELLKLYQVDFNKSIRDIQDRFQRRWISYEPKLTLTQSDLSFYLGYSSAGSDASTINLGLEGLAIILESNEVIVIVGARLQNVSSELFTILYSQGSGNIGTFELLGLNATRNGYKLSSPELDPIPDRVGTSVKWTFAQGSTTWAVEGTVSNKMAETLSEWAPLSDTLLPLFQKAGGSSLDIRKGDVIHYPSGPNAGFYRIVEKSGSFVVVDHAPLSFSDETTSLTQRANVYRPVGFKVTQPSQTKTNTFSVSYTPGANDLSVLAPGRVVVVNGQAFKVIRSVVDINQFVTSVIVTVDSTELPAGLRGLNWRAPNTLTSASQNFADLGVSTGDLLVFDIVLTGSESTSEIVGQVVGVTGNSLGFVMTNGVVPAGVVPQVPKETYLKLASDFGIDGVSVSQSGEIVLSGTAKEYFKSLSSGTFKRTYWNKELTPSSDVQVNPVFRIKPKYIIRNKLLPVDDTLRSVPTLQEWIVQPTVRERAGKFYQVSNDKEFELKNKPVVISENLDYLIDDEFVYVGPMTINTGSAEVSADDADFIDRNIIAGDFFIIDSPITLSATYTIEAVLSNNKIRLTRPVPAYVLGEFVTAQVIIKRKKTGHFLRFVPGLFNATNPAPARLWAEVSFFDNDQSVEDNFGILVGLKKETLESVTRDINYRQAVSGLMFAFTRGSAIDKVRLGAQILLGLPFAEHRGIVRSIEGDYRLDVTGTPILGRILVEDVDSTGAALGTLRIYTFPIDTASALAGVETSPVTGKTYVAGDLVELFAPLCKGVEIIDSQTNPLDSNFSSIAQLQQYHAVRLRANDNIFSLIELGLVSDFLRKITPSYIAYSLITASEFADTVKISDILFNGIRNDNALIDNASLGLAPALLFNSKSADGLPQILWEDGVQSVRRFGTDLVTVDGSADVTSAAGGFINPKAHEIFEPPLVRSTDYLIIFDGVNQGTYLVGGVVDDTTITLTMGAPALGFEDAVGQRFMIVRKVTSLAPFAAGTASVTTGSSTVDLAGSPHLRTRGVAPGDWLLLGNGTSTERYLIRQVKEQIPTSNVWNRLDITPASKFTSGFASYSIYRPSLLVGGTHEVTSTGTNNLDITSAPDLSGLLSIGDELVLDTLGKDRVTVLDPISMYVTPVVPAGTYNATIAFKNRSSTIIGWDHIEKYDPVDVLEAALVESEPLATCTSSSNVVSLQVERTTAPTSAAVSFDPQAGKVLPGDLLALTSGGNSTVDVGFGPGLYPIVQVTPTDVRLSVALTASGTASWKIVRRR